MYSLMSIWINALGSPKSSLAIVLASSVLPTPVGPSSAKAPIGRMGSLRSARERRSALLKASTASLWPMIVSSSVFSMLRSFLISSFSIRCRGMPVHLEITCMMSSSEITTRLSALAAFHSSMEVSRFSLACFSSSRMAAARSKSCSLIASSFFSLISSILCSSSLISGGRVIVLMRAREPASSMTSIALSGR